MDFRDVLSVWDPEALGLWDLRIFIVPSPHHPEVGAPKVHHLHLMFKMMPIMMQLCLLGWEETRRS